MNNEDFRNNLDTIHEKIETVLGAKGEEYATDNDRLHNFKVAAQDLVTSRLRILSETSLDDSPTVAPNGTMLIYATRQQGRGVLMLVSTNGRVRLPIPTAQGDVREPSWSPFLN